MNDRQRAGYEGHGYLHIEEALGFADLSRFRDAFDAATREEALTDLPNCDDCFIGLAEHPLLFPLVHRIMSDDVQLRSLAGIFIGPGAPGRGWHRRVAGMLGVHHPASNMCLQLVISLDDLAVDGACPTVVPASHLLKSEVPFPEITRIEEMPHQLPLHLKAGSAALLHGNIWQARLRNDSDRPVRLLEYAYVHSWMRQALPELSPRALQAVSERDNLAHLFGAAPYAGYWTGEVSDYPSSDGLPGRRYSPLRGVGQGTVQNQ